MSIHVCVYKVKGRRFYRAQWIDPVTGQRRFRSTGTAFKREAERFAARLEDELKDAADKPVDAPWSVFRQRYDAEHLAYKAASTRSKTRTALDYVERFINPKTVGSLRKAQLVTLTNELRQKGLQPPSIAAHLRHIRAGLHWAKKGGILNDVPKFIFPDEHKRPGGRPVSLEEFERMLDTCHNRRRDVADSWEHLLWGLWWSGLRINEAMNLTWGRTGLLTMDFSGKHPLFDIKAELSKNRKAERFPLPPEFCDFVMETRKDQRRGYVFDPGRLHITPHGVGRLPTNRVSELIAEFGKAAGIKVADREGGPVFASAHDLRRTFGFRWAKRVMPPILQKMMRHADIKTTMVFYLTQDEQQTAAAVWEAAGGAPKHTLRHTLPSGVDASPYVLKERTEAERMRGSSRPVQV